VTEQQSPESSSADMSVTALRDVVGVAGPAALRYPACAELDPTMPTHGVEPDPRGLI
jgi:hypothetical protein